MRTKSLFAAMFWLLLSGCVKQEIPSDKKVFVGLWEMLEKADDTKYEIEIRQDGTGRYTEVTLTGQKEFTGFVYFKSASEFTIGGKIIKKKIKITKYPTKIIEGLKPYKFHYEATFNGIRYKRID